VNHGREEKAGNGSPPAFCVNYSRVSSTEFRTLLVVGIVPNLQHSFYSQLTLRPSGRISRDRPGSPHMGVRKRTRIGSRTSANTDHPCWRQRSPAGLSFHLFDEPSGKSQVATNTKMLPNNNRRPTALCLLFSFSMANLDSLMSLVPN
jgi:hypothetical protein